MSSCNKKTSCKGKDLIRLLKDEGQKYGATSMDGHFTSQEALGAFISAMGRETILFRARYSGKPAKVTIEDAMKHPEVYVTSAEMITVQLSNRLL